jgi:hypothetical protein
MIEELVQRSLQEIAKRYAADDRLWHYSPLLNHISAIIARACQEAYKLGHDDIFEGMDAENQRLRQQLEQTEADLKAEVMRLDWVLERKQYIDIYEDDEFFKVRDRADIDATMK